MHDLRFRPNRIAQTLYHHRSQTIGCILPDIGNPFFSQLFQHLEMLAFERGYTMIMGNTLSTRALERTYLQALSERQVDGLLYLGGLANDATPDPEDLRAVQDVAERLPVVVVNGDLPVPGVVSSVRSDERGGTRALLDLLRAHGHTRVAFLGGRSDIGNTLEKLEEYRAAFPDLPLDWVQLSGLSIDSGRSAMTALLRHPQRPTAAVCINDLVAAGALAAAREHGLTLPRDLSVTGFDDVFVAQVVTPTLTTVNHDDASLARHALDALTGSIEGERPERHILIPSSLVTRGSVTDAPTLHPLTGNATRRARTAR